MVIVNSALSRMQWVSLWLNTILVLAGNWSVITLVNRYHLLMVKPGFLKLKQTITPLALSNYHYRLLYNVLVYKKYLRKISHVNTNNYYLKNILRISLIKFQKAPTIQHLFYTKYRLLLFKPKMNFSVYFIFQNY